MAITNVMNNQVAFFALGLIDPTTQAVVPVPTGDVFTAVLQTASTSLGVSVGIDPGTSGLLGVIATPMVLESDSGNGGGNFMINVTDSNGDLADIIGPVNIVVVPVVNQITAAGATFTTQAPPTAPGP